MQPDVCKFGCGGKEVVTAVVLLAGGFASSTYKGSILQEAVWVLEFMHVQIGISFSQDGQALSATKGPLTVNYSGSDQLVSVIPGSKLSGGDASLRFVEDNVPTPFGHVQYTSLQGLAIADPHREAGLFAGF